MAQITTSLFDGVTKDEYAAMTECFKATVKTYKKGEEVPMPEGRVGVVQRGRISVMRTDADGVRTIFEQLAKGGGCGTPTGCARSDAGYFLLADEDCDVLMIDYEHIVKRCPKACAHHSTVVANLVKLMSEKTQALSEHLEILSRRTTREKLTAYFSMLAAKNKSAYFTLPFSQTSLADYICVDRSAMARELKRMCDEGLIELERRNKNFCTKKSRGVKKPRFFRPKTKGLPRRPPGAGAPRLFILKLILCGRIALYPVVFARLAGVSKKSQAQFCFFRKYLEHKFGLVAVN